MRKRRFLDILAVFGLDLGQISLKLVKNAPASRQLGFLATGIAFCDFSLGHFDLCLKAFRFLEFFFRLSLFSFSFLFATVIDLLLGLLAVKKLLRKHHRDGQFLPGSSQE